MKLLFSEEVPDNMLLGYLVLNATERLEFPLMKIDVGLNLQHLDNAPNGAAVTIASQSHRFYSPQHGRTYNMFSAQHYESEEECKHVLTTFAGNDKTTLQEPYK